MDVRYNEAVSTMVVKEELSPWNFHFSGQEFLGFFLGEEGREGKGVIDKYVVVILIVIINVYGFICIYFFILCKASAISL